LRSAIYSDDERPVDEACDCYTCRHFSRAYLRHLIIAGEWLAGTLLSIHNIRTLTRLMEEIRQAILDGTFEQRLPEWLHRWQGNAKRKMVNAESE
jgi:queuine tRNA-ribosyltransferase